MGGEINHSATHSTSSDSLSDDYGKMKLDNDFIQR